MTFYYIVRDVQPGARCSYKPGRTLLNNGPINRYQDQAESVVERYNRFCGVAGVVYTVVPHDDSKTFDCDHFEG